MNEQQTHTHSPCGVRSEGNSICGSVVASVSMVTSSSYKSVVGVSGTSVVPLSPSSGGGGRGSVSGSSSGATVGVWGRGNKRPVPFGPGGSASSTTVLSVVVVVVPAATVTDAAAAVVVVGAGGMVTMDGSGGATAGASVRVSEGKVGGSVGAAVTL